MVTAIQYLRAGVLANLISASLLCAGAAPPAICSPHAQSPAFQIVEIRRLDYPERQELVGRSIRTGRVTLLHLFTSAGPDSVTCAPDLHRLFVRESVDLGHGRGFLTYMHVFTYSGKDLGKMRIPEHDEDWAEPTYRNGRIWMWHVNTNDVYSIGSKDLQVRQEQWPSLPPSIQYGMDTYYPAGTNLSGRVYVPQPGDRVGFGSTGQLYAFREHPKEKTTWRDQRTGRLISGTILTENSWYLCVYDFATRKLTRTKVRADEITPSHVRHKILVRGFGADGEPLSFKLKQIGAQLGVVPEFQSAEGPDGRWTPSDRYVGVFEWGEHPALSVFDPTTGRRVDKIRLKEPGTLEDWDWATEYK